jgi:hypothetical protein
MLYAVSLQSRSSTLRKAAIEAFILNGIVFLGSVLFLEAFYNHPHNHFLGCPYRVSCHIEAIIHIS